MIAPNSFYIHPTSTPEPTHEPAPAPAADAAKANAMFDHPSSSKSPAPSSATPPKATPSHPDERAEAFFDAPIVAGKSDAFRAGTSNLIALGQLDATAAAKAEVEILGLFRKAKVDGLAEAGIAARVGKEPLTPAKEKKMQLDTLARIQREFGSSASEVKQEIRKFMDRNPSLRDLLGGFVNEPAFALKLADVVWSRRKR